MQSMRLLYENAPQRHSLRKYQIRGCGGRRIGDERYQFDWNALILSERFVSGKRHVFVQWLLQPTPLGQVVLIDDSRFACKASPDSIVGLIRQHLTIHTVKSRVCRIQFTPAMTVKLAIGSTPLVMAVRFAPDRFIPGRQTSIHSHHLHHPMH